MKNTNKTIWTLLIAIVTLVALCAFAASAEVVTGNCGLNGSNLTWKYNTETKTLTILGTGAMEEFQDQTPWDNYKNDIQTVSISDGATSLTNNAFAYCTSLESVSIPVGVMSIGYGAFQGCTSLTSVSFSTGLLRVGNSAFSNCTALTGVTLPTGLKTVSYDAFYNCTALADIEIPDSVTKIESRAFDNTAYYNDVSNWENGVLYIGNHLIKAKADAVSGSYTVKSGTITIAQEAFSGCDSLTSVELPDTVTSIGASAFENCTALENVLIPDSVTIIDFYAFSGCASLNNIDFPDNLVSLGNGVLDGTAYYNSVVNWDRGVLYVGNNLIKADEAISGEYTVREGTKTIAVEAFVSCAEVTEISLPESLENIGIYAFAGCSSLTSLSIPANVKRAPLISMSATLETVALAEGLQRIDTGMLALTGIEDVVVPNSVESIASIAFCCPNLKTVHLGTELQSIGLGAFNMEAAYGENHPFTIYTCMTEEAFSRIETETWTLEDEENEGGTPPAFFAAIPDTATIVYNAHIPGEAQQETVPATGTTPAHIDNVTYCTLCGREVSRELVETLEGHTHNYVAAWTWSNDGTTAEVVLTCAGCGDVSDVLRAEVTREEQPDGSVICTATVTYGGKTYSKEKVIPAPQPTPVKPSSRCKMCNFYEEYKDVPFAGWIISIVHFFVHMASRIGA